MGVTDSILRTLDPLFENSVFLKQLRDTGVFYKNGDPKTGRIWFFSLVGMLMFVATGVFYGLLAQEFDYEFTEKVIGHSGNPKGRIVKLLWAVLGLHIFTGVLVAYDTVYKAGSNIFVQTIIIGTGTFNTIVQGVVFISLLGEPRSRFYAVGYSTASFVLACLSNAMMVALLFAIFHRGTRQAFGLGTIALNVGASVEQGGREHKSVRKSLHF